MGLVINEGKTKYTLPTSRDRRHIDFQITADNYTFDALKEFIYLGSAVTIKNDMNLEIKRKITLANRWYYGLNGQLSNRDLSRTIKLILYNNTNTLWHRGMESIKQTYRRLENIREKSKIFDPVQVGDDFRIRYNSELYELLNDMDVV